MFHVMRPTLEVCSGSNDIDEDLHETEANSTTVPPTASITIEFNTNDDEIYNMDAVCKTISTSKTTVLQNETQHLSYKTRENVSVDEENSQNCNKLRKQLQEANALNAMLQQKLTLMQRKNKRFENRMYHLLTLLKHFYRRTKCYRKMLVRFQIKYQQIPRTFYSGKKKE